MRRYRDSLLSPLRRNKGDGAANHGRADDKNVCVNANGIEEAGNGDGWRGKWLLRWRL